MRLIGLSFLRDQNRGKEKRMGEEEEEEEEEKRRRRRRDLRYGTMTISMDTCFGL